MTNCMIAGVGGQGTVLASKLLAAAAMDKGLQVRTTETIGMAQRGGIVVSHVRMGAHIHSPLVPHKAAHIIIAFEPAEAVRLLPFLAVGGTMIVCDSAIKPVTSSLSGDGYEASSMIDILRAHVTRLVVINGAELLGRCGNAKTLNVALLGAAVQSGVLPFDADELENSIRSKIPQRYLEMNLAAFHIGKELYHEQ